MPSAKITYDPQLRKTEHGRRIYAYWRRIRMDEFSPEFEEFPGFYHWAMENGYTVGARLLKYDLDEPYTPDNCFWLAREDWKIGDAEEQRNRAMEQKWDATVNRIRLHFGMEPIHSSEV